MPIPTSGRYNTRSPAVPRRSPSISSPGADPEIPSGSLQDMTASSASLSSTGSFYYSAPSTPPVPSAAPPRNLASRIPTPRPRADLDQSQGVLNGLVADLSSQLQNSRTPTVRLSSPGSLLLSTLQRIDSITADLINRDGDGDVAYASAVTTLTDYLRDCARHAGQGQVVIAPRLLNRYLSAVQAASARRVRAATPPFSQRSVTVSVPTHPRPEQRDAAELQHLLTRYGPALNGSTRRYRPDLNVDQIVLDLNTVRNINDPSGRAARLRVELSEQLSHLSQRTAPSQPPMRRGRSTNVHLAGHDRTRTPSSESRSRSHSRHSGLEGQ